MKKYAVLDIGGTQIKYGIIDQNGQLLYWKQQSTNAHLGGKCLMDTAIQMIKELQKKESISGIGVATAGVVDSDTGTIVYANENIPGYTGIEIKKIMEEEFKLPCEVENDVACAGLCEAHTGAGKKCTSVACMTIGTGIGGSLIIDGKVYHGFGNCAGEIGYLPLGNSTFEKEASMSALINRVNRRIEAGYEIDGKEIFNRALHEDLLCQEEIDRMCSLIGEGIAAICAIIDPEVIVIGGGVCAQGEWFRKKIEIAFFQHQLPITIRKTRIVLAEKENQAGMIGAWVHFFQKQGEAYERI